MTIENLFTGGALAMLQLVGIAILIGIIYIISKIALSNLEGDFSIGKMILWLIILLIVIVFGIFVVREVSHIAMATWNTTTGEVTIPPLPIDG